MTELQNYIHRVTGTWTWHGFRQYMKSMRIRDRYMEAVGAKEYRKFWQVEHHKPTRA